MKAIRFHEYGDADVLRDEDVEVPVPGSGEVRIRVAATAFNPVDAGIRGGYLREPFPVLLPHVPGIDAAGTVDALGANVSGRRVGDRVIGFLPMVPDGAAAEYVVAPAEILADAPTSIPLVDAAALPSVGLTAWQSLFEYADLRAGQRLLVHGAGGAVGGYAIQLAKRAGAHVIATASPRSSERVRAAGADEIIDRTTAGVADAVGAPVDVVLNLAPIAPAELGAIARLVRPGGAVLSTVPSAVGDEASDVSAVAVFARSDAGQLANLVAMIDAGELQVDVSERLPLSELPAVHARSDAGTLPGKIVLLAGAA
ncbi:MAG TPA: NADP-dependent oxidoreductase [Solirubrobacteraceae bacterium]|nr:NADP-dependent oxidoreductase [Solirubrobacteraceae bacterium]